jgi:hypothetical protein
MNITRTVNGDRIMMGIIYTGSVLTLNILWGRSHGTCGTRIIYCNLIATNTIKTSMEFALIFLLFWKTIPLF